MFANNALSDRLNEIKNGNPIPKLQTDPIIQKETQIEVVPNTTSIIPTAKQLFIVGITDLLSLILISTFYGFGLETILNKDWNFLGTFSVGFILHQLLIYFFKLVKKT